MYYLAIQTVWRVLKKKRVLQVWLVSETVAYKRRGVKNKGNLVLSTGLIM